MGELEDRFEEAGLLWPAGIKPSSVRHALDRVGVIDEVLKHCRQRRVVIQAGGMQGLWPLRFAKSFRAVHTFEPEPLLFELLALNTRQVPNIYARSAALGESPGLCGIHRAGLGGHTVIPGDSIRVETIDDLALAEVDLIQLDVEGYEAKAIRGALQTIDLSRPLILLEWRGLGERYGDTADDLSALLRPFGYRAVARLRGDLLFSCDRRR